MRADLSRITHRPERQYTRVVAQQGRVDLDADRNEAQDIQIDRLRRVIVDLFGPFGGPRHLWDAAGDWGRENEGFRIENDNGDFTWGPGRYYVDGWDCTTVAGIYSSQSLLPWDEDNDHHDRFEVPDPPYLVYLDVWERLITSLDDDSIREVALNGPDTAARGHLVCQVRFIAEADLPDDTLDNLPDLAKQAEMVDWWAPILKQLRGGQKPALKVEASRPADTGKNPCLAVADAAYVGPENQLYRVEIHNVDENGRATFKFSRNNGSDEAAIREINGKFLTIDGSPDPNRGFAAGQWIELIDEERELLGEPGTLVRIGLVEGNELTLIVDAANSTLDPDRFGTRPKVRRWDQTGKGPINLDGGGIEVTPGEWIPLEYGIRIMFEDGGPDRSYRTGDYWTFAARYRTGDVEWPEDQFLPPHGIVHSFAPLAVVRQNSVDDLRILKDTWIV